MRTEFEKQSSGVSPVSSALLAEWLRISITDESAALLTLLIDSATEAVENYTGWSVVTHSLRRRWSGKIKRPLILPLPWVDSISSLVYVDSDGDSNAITEYTFNESGILYIPEQYVYCGEDDYVECIYTTRANTDNNFKMAILKTAAFLYERRGDCDSAMALKTSGAADLLSGSVCVFL